MTNKTIHQGRNVKRFREMLGIKQDALADALGEDWSQKKVSLLEGKEEIDGDTLERVAEVLKVPVKAIENFDESAAITFINTFNDNSVSNGPVSPVSTFNGNSTSNGPVSPVSTFNDNCLSNGIFSLNEFQINPVERWLEAMDENRRLYEELLKSEREKVAMMERMMKL